MDRLAKVGLLWQFAVTSFVVIAVLGLALGWLLAQMVERNALNDAQNEATETLSQRVLKRLSPDDLAMAMSGERYLEFQRFVEESVVSGRTARVKIWNPHGLVVYSNNESELGQTYPIKDELGQALQGRVAREVSELLSIENLGERQYGRLLEVYAPIVFPGDARVSGAFEIYQYYEPIAQLTRVSQRELYLGLAAGLLVLYAALFFLVKRGHDTIDHQRRRLGALYRTGRDMRSSLELDRLLEQIVTEAAGLVGADSGVLMLSTENGERLQVASSYTRPGVGASESVVAVDEKLAERVMRQGNTCLLEHDCSKSELHSAAKSGLPLPRCSMYVPLKYRERTIGVIAISQCSQIRAFGNDDVALVGELAGQAAVAIEQAGLLNTVRLRAEALKDAYQGTLEALSAALDLRDGGTEEHSKRVVEGTRLLAQAMNVPDDQQEAIIMGSLLHDIGKIGVPDAILRKPGPLTEEEWAVMRLHPEKGHQMLVNIPFLSEAAPIVLHHHERWDGRGYPHGLAGEVIPLGSRIFAVIDTYDAITSDRPYRKGASHSEAVREIRLGVGTQFDPAVASAFLQLADKISLPVWLDRRSPNPVQDMLSR